MSEQMSGGGLNLFTSLYVFSHSLESLMACATVMILVGLAILARKLWKMHSKATSHYFAF